MAVENLDALTRVGSNDLLVNEQEGKGNWAERALDGFWTRTKESASKPVETALTVGTGVGIGLVIQGALNNAELMGGRVGQFGRVAKAALFYVPAAMIGAQISRADDAAAEVGKIAFDYGLFLGAAKIGRTFGDRIPGVQKLIEPRAVSPVPDGLSYRVSGDMVTVNAFPKGHGVQQVRLANGQGFVTPSVATDYPAGVKSVHHTFLVGMPKEVRGVGLVEYGPRSTTLRQFSDGQAFTKDLNTRIIHTDSAAAGRLQTKTDTSFDLVKADGTAQRFHFEGTQQVMKGELAAATINKGGSGSLIEGSLGSGRSWNFNTDGSISMHSLPYAKFKLNLNPQGEGIYSVTAGTSRGIAGMVGPRSNATPLSVKETPVRLKDGVVVTHDGAPVGLTVPKLPALEPVPDAGNLFRARQVLNDLPNHRYW